MVAKSSAKEVVHKIVEEMTDEQIVDLLDYLNLVADPDELTEEELREVEAADARIDAGDYVTLEQLREKHGLSETANGR